MDVDMLSNWLGKDMKKTCDKVVQILNVSLHRPPLLPGQGCTPRESRLSRKPLQGALHITDVLSAGKDWESLRDKEMFRGY